MGNGLITIRMNRQNGADAQADNPGEPQAPGLNEDVKFITSAGLKNPPERYNIVLIGRSDPILFRGHPKASRQNETNNTPFF